MTPVTRPLGIGALVAETFRMLARHFGFLFPLAFVPALGVAALGTGIATPDAGGVPGTGDVVLLLVTVFLSFLVTGVMCLAALDAVIGTHHTIGEYLAQALRHLAPIAGLGLAVSLAAGIGFAALFVPGLYVLARYLPLVPAIVFENAGWSGLGRAQDLTAGYRWPIAGAIVAMGLLAVLILVVTGPVLMAAGHSPALAILVEAVLSGLSYALAAIFTALVYLRLREIREGASPSSIAAEIG